MSSDIENKKALVDAFDDGFRNQLLVYEEKIKKKLSATVEAISTKSPGSRQGIIGGMESRVKSPESFEEKISRKDYIHTWTISEDKTELQREICMKLPDLIGLRITCLFQSDEDFVYNKLYDSIPIINSSKAEGIFLNPKGSDGTTQQNGHKIYKMTGVYQPENSVFPRVNFEIQIKSFIHNVWGEVEHKTIYKGIQYDINPTHKKTMTEEIYNILSASDRQLQSLFENTHDECDLIKALFFEQTKLEVAKNCGSKILAKYYYSFFNLFWDGIEKTVREYVSVHMTDPPLVEKYHPQILAEQSFFSMPDNESGNMFMAILYDFVEKVFEPYHFSILYHILKTLFVTQSGDSISKFIICSEFNILSRIPTETDNFGAKDPFFDDPDSEEDSDLTIYIKPAAQQLTKKLEDAIKESIVKEYKENKLDKDLLTYVLDKYLDIDKYFEKEGE